MRYGRVTALDQVTITVSDGEAVAVIGANGAGKSTLVRAVTGTVRCTSGEIRYDGRSIAALKPEQRVRAGIALVPERRQIFGTLTVAENLRMGTTVREDRDEAKADVENMLELFPVLATYYKRSAAQLSGGEQQQLAVARALLSRPRLLVLDEPSFGLAPVLVELVFEVLAGLRRRGDVAILLIEQNAERAVVFADRTYLFRTGTIVREGARGEFAPGDADVADAYLGLRV